MGNAATRTAFRLALAIIIFAGSAGAHAGLQEEIAAYKKANYPAALKELRPLADNGDAKAQVLLGEIYSSGKGVPQDHVEAALWYRKAAEQGDAGAQATLGVMYDNGVGVAQDSKEAISWFRKAAEQGDTEAQYILGGMYKRGQDVLPVDLVQAHKWFNLAMVSGYEIARQDVEETEAMMSAEQIEKARLIEKGWLAKHR